MTPEEFESAAHFIKQRSGLVLTRDKAYLIENRLLPVVRERHLKSVSELLAAAQADDAVMQSAIVDAMMAKETGFFRDWKPFVHFGSVVLPNLRVARGMKTGFRILCAGVSTGQEAYSVAMAIRNVASCFSGWQTEIMGIDISSTAMTAAAKGVYNQFDVQRGLPVRALLRHFTKREDAWVLKEDVRDLVTFQTWNLLDDLFSLGRFDVILCRNVMTYFDLRTKIDVLQKLSRLLVDDGVLYLGLNETLSGVSNAFRSVEPSMGIYTAHRTDRPASLSLAAKIGP